MTSEPIKLVNITHDLLQQQTAPLMRSVRTAPTNRMANGGRKPSRACRARPLPRAFASLEIMRGPRAVGCLSAKLAARSSCPAGQTRISLRIIEQLTQHLLRPGSSPSAVAPARTPACRRLPILDSSSRLSTPNSSGTPTRPGERPSPEPRPCAPAAAGSGPGRRRSRRLRRIEDARLSPLPRS